jgi:hypothetical protein
MEFSFGGPIIDIADELGTYDALFPWSPVLTPVPRTGLDEAPAMAALPSPPEREMPAPLLPPYASRSHQAPAVATTGQPLSEVLVLSTHGARRALTPIPRKNVECASQAPKRHPGADSRSDTVREVGHPLGDVVCPVSAQKVRRTRARVVPDALLANMTRPPTAGSRRPSRGAAR